MDKNFKFLVLIEIILRSNKISDFANVENLLYLQICLRLNSILNKKTWANLFYDPPGPQRTICANIFTRK